MAIVKARERVPDVVLLNLKMARVNGYAVCLALKADPRTQRTPIIMLSGGNHVAEQIQAIGMGADDYVSKPLDGEELRGRIRTVLGRSYA